MKRHFEDFEAAARSEIVSMVRAETGTNEHEALRLASRILQVMAQTFGGSELYVPKSPGYNRDAVLADIKARRPVRDVCRRHRIGKRTYYALQREAWGGTA